MSFADRVTAYRQRVDTALEHWLPPATTHPERFHAALRYAVLGGGKRVRPLLVYAAGEWLGLPAARLDGIAAALEIVHAYSLAHDDLPAMDDDNLRRGRPTTHIAFDEATAILAGDALQAHAYFVLATDAALDATPAMRRSLVLDLARASGSAGMAGGQALELDPAGATQATLAAVEARYWLKTGRLIEAAVTMPCRLLAPDDDTALAMAQRYGRALGLGFQIADDLIDIECSAEVSGKPQGSDQRNGRTTVPDVIGVPATRQRLAVLRDEARTALAGAGGSAEGLRWLGDEMLAGQGTTGRSA